MSLTALERDGGVATLLLDPPSGGYDRAFMEALAARTRELTEHADEIHAVVVAAAGTDTGGGWSASALEEAPDALARPLGAAFDELARVPQPLVGALRGRVHSAGLELALACDIRVAAAGATFAMPETGAGMVPMGGATQRLPRAIGRAQALRLLLTGEEIDASEARRIGLVSRVVPDGEEIAAATAIAATIASRGPIATRFAKEAVHRGVELPLEQALRYELDLTVILQTTEDRAEGVRAFIERRPPEFKGR